jgi:hypothetical protein
MAADILIYNSNVVPVGRDQKQHVEVTRDLAQKMNAIYGDVFVLPEASILPNTETIPGLDGQKMSKSYGNTIGLFEEEKALRKKVMAIVTDSTPVETPKDPTGSTIVGLYRLFAPESEVSRWRRTFERAAPATANSRNGSSAPGGNTSLRCGLGGRSWKPILGISRPFSERALRKQRRSRVPRWIACGAPSACGKAAETGALKISEWLHLAYCFGRKALTMVGHDTGLLFGSVNSK